jgi:hypothetical protein
MSDRELLELAAKAAGNGAQWGCPERGMMVLSANGCDTDSWNPLKSPGDAMCLAALLGMRVTCAFFHSLEQSHSAYVEIGCDGWGAIEVQEPKGYIKEPFNVLEATCRAITRAAAELGKLK